ncbi:MAG: class I SAM-dependent methyltransferase [Acidimicrobiia bacterium]|nr:class I SAM-dependent methyltransferase [Acidimicrobiia bacterium]
MDDPWERHAGWWQAGFTGGADPEYEEQILPMALEHLRGARRVLEVGAGEGQVARAARSAGAGLVVGVEPATAQVRTAVARGGGPRFLRAVADALPFPDGSFDAVVACLVFEHVGPFEAAIGEVARVLEPGGRFLLFLNHPLLQAPDSGWVDDHILDEQYWRVGPYLPEDRRDEEISPGVTLPFWHRPLSRYVNALVERGLVIRRMDEPAPPPGFVARAPEYREAVTIPRLLFLRAQRAS